MLMRQRGPFLARLEATQVTYGWQQTRGVLFCHIPHFHPWQQRGDLHDLFPLVNGWFFLALFWASHLVRPYLWSMHGHIAACCVCVRAAGVVSLTHLSFYVSVSGWFFLLLPNPPGFQYILCNVALLLLAEEQQRLPSQEVGPLRSLHLSLWQKHRHPFPAINNQVSRRLKIIAPINQGRTLGRAAERRLALLLPWSDSDRGLSVSERNSYDRQTWDQCWAARTVPGSAADTSETSCFV